MLFVYDGDAIEIFVHFEIKGGVLILHDIVKPICICEELARQCMFWTVVQPLQIFFPVTYFTHVVS